MGLMRRCIVACCLILAFCYSSAAVYEVRIADGNKAVVTVTLDSGITGRAFRMPAWAPGDYRIVDFGRALSDVKFLRSGKEVPFTRGADVNLWSVPVGADSVSYTVSRAKSGMFSDNLYITDTEVFIQGPAVFGYFENDQANKQTLKVQPYPSPAATVLCALERVAGSAVTFTAVNYDAMVDAPIVMGTSLRVKNYMANGKPQTVVAFRKPDAVDLDSFANLGTAVAKQSYEIFGELPYSQYYFLFDFGGTDGGLEHANSAHIGMSPGSTAQGASSYVAHEFFHLYNVKRIRAKPLGPFDYSKPAVTGALWWLEGVTDYYAGVLTVRTGYQTRDEFIRSLSEEAVALKRFRQRLKVSADESSRRVWEVGNSSGYGVDYYLKGRLIGWCLDMAIRSATQGARSLDDVMKTLYEECKNGKPGFEENRIRELVVRIGGEKLGPLYDRLVMQAVELPVEELLPDMGMIWDGVAKDDPNAPEKSRGIGAKWPQSVK